MRGAIWQGAATVEADADRVITLLRETLGNRWLGLATVQALDDGVAVEGGWWYRAEYHVEAIGERRSRVTNDIHNVAPAASRWMVPFTAHRRSAQFRAAFRELLDSIGGGTLDNQPS